MEGRKRKREPDAPRIKYHVEQLDRSFERILKEDSRQELREIVRKKLGLDPSTDLELVQVREGKLYDLEDDDDFEAFRAAAFAYSSLDVRVSFSGGLSSQDVTSGHVHSVSQPSAVRASLPDLSTEPASSRKVRRKKVMQNLSLEDQVTQDGSVVQSPSIDGGRGTDEPVVAPPKKRRKTDPANLPGEAMETVPSTKKRKSLKVKEPEDLPSTFAGPAHQELEQEPPQKKRKKLKGKGITSQEEQAPVPAALTVESSTSDQSPATNPKSKRGNETSPLPSAVDTTPPLDPGVSAQTKAPKAKMKQKGLVGKHVSHHEASPFVGVVSTSAPSAPAPRNKASRKASVSVRSLLVPESSTSSQIQSTISAFLKKPRTSAEILASFSGFEAKGLEGDGNREPESAPVQTVTLVNIKKKKGKPVEGMIAVSKEAEVKASSKVKPGRSRLSESRFPEASSAPSTQQTSPSVVVQSNAVAVPTAPPVTLPPRSAPTRTKQSKMQSSKSTQSDAPCPVCASRPFHFRFQCPVIQSGVDAIRARITELKKEDGREELVKDLEEWVTKEEIKKKNKPTHMPAMAANIEKDASVASGESLGLKGAFSSRSERHGSPLPSWTPILPLESQPSEVTIESRAEGSSSESASSQSEEDVPGKQSHITSESESDSEPESESESDSPSRSSADRVVQSSENLEDVDLDALIRGPALKIQAVTFAELEDESDDENGAEDEGEVGLLEEDEEEGRERRPKGWKIERSISPDTNGDEDDDEVDIDSYPVQLDISVPEALSDSGDASQKNEVANHPPTELQADRDLSQTRSASPATAHDKEAEAREAVDTPAESTSSLPQTMLEGVPADDNDLEPVTPQSEVPPAPSTPRATTPIRSITPHSRVAIGTPGTVRRMKDRHGNLPLIPSDDDIEIEQAPLPVLLDFTMLPAFVQRDEDEVVEQPQRSRSQAPSRPQSKAQFTASQTRSRSGTTPLRNSGTPAPSDSVSSTSQTAAKKRRGRPPLSEAIKAERKALKEAEKAAKAAERLAKGGKKKAPTASRKTRTKTSEPEPDPAEASSQPDAPVSEAASPSGLATHTPLSQWKALPPPTLSSEVSRPSPAVDQLLSSSSPPLDVVFKPMELAEKVPAELGALDGIKSPVSITSASRKYDEDDVEHIIGTPNHSEQMPPPKRQPLFLPGASQMTQSQTFPRFQSLGMDEGSSEPAPGEQEQFASDSHTEPDSDDHPPRKTTISRPNLPSKSAFPSLSQLSFDKFRPSFLLSGRVFSQSKEKHDMPHSDEDSESEDDDESSDGEKRSHIPKNRRAGAGVVKKRKSRGLLHA